MIMNTLSWFFYLADIIGNISVFFIAGSIIMLVLSLGVALIVAIQNEDESLEPGEPGYVSPYIVKPYVIVGGIMLFISTFIPQTETIYMIAGSELGQATIQSEVGQDIMNKLQTILDLQIEEMKDK